MVASKTFTSIVGLYRDYTVVFTVTNSTGNQEKTIQLPQICKKQVFETDFSNISSSLNCGGFTAKLTSESCF